MEALVAQAIRDTTTFRKTSVPWALDEPYAQTYYGFDPATSTWVSKLLPSALGKSSSNDNDSSAITSIALYTWNIDFMLPFAAARMRPALAHLHKLTRLLPLNVAPVIFLQECTPSDLETIAATPWVQANFHLTDIDTTNWATAQYGTTVLASKLLPLISVFRVHYSHTRMDRDALFVDVSIGLGEKRIRLCNTHLESMALDPPYRPPQMQLVAQYMHHDGLYAALAAGDFNAIQPFDRTLHVDNDLKDAFLELGEGRTPRKDIHGANKQQQNNVRSLGVPEWTRFIFVGRSGYRSLRDLEKGSWQRGLKKGSRS